MPGPALIGIGEFGKRALAALRAGGTDPPPAVLAIADCDAAPGPVTGPGTAPGTGEVLAVTRSLRDFTGVELPPYPAEREPAGLAGDEVLAPPAASVDALEAALALGPSWLPASVARAPESWLAALGRPPRPDRIARRLLWPRLEKPFGACLPRLRAGSDGSFILIADLACPLASGLLLEVLQAARGTLTAAACVLAPLVPSADLQALLAELAAAAAAGESPPIVVLAPGFDPALLDGVVRALPAAAVPSGAGLPSYHGRPLAFAVARGARLGAPVDAARWQVSKRVAEAVLGRLLARRPAGGSDGATVVRDLLAQAPLPAFASRARKPLPELLRELRPAPFPALSAEDEDGARRRLDALFARRADELAEREARHQGEIQEWLTGGKLSRLGHVTSAGFLALLAGQAVAAVAAGGIEAATTLLATVAAELRAGGAGEPRPQLKPKLAELERARAGLRPGVRSGSRTLSSLLGKKDPERVAETERLLAEQARLLLDILRLREADGLLSAAGELWSQAVAAVDAIDAELRAVAVAAATALEAVSAAAQATADALPAELLETLASEARLDPGTVLQRLLVHGALGKWAISPQALLDDLWGAARLPLTGAALLGRMAGVGERLRDAYEGSARGHSAEALPRRLRREPQARLVAPSEPLVREVAAHLRFPAEGELQPGGDRVALVAIESGLTDFALLVGPEPPRRGGSWLAGLAARAESAGTAPAPLASPAPEGLDPYEALLLATLGAGDVEELALVDRALAQAESVRTTGNAEEVELLLGLAPVSEALRKAGEVSDAADRTLYLEEARRALAAWGGRAAEELVEPERGLAQVAAARWLERLGRKLAASRGRAEVRLKLRARRLALTGAALRVEVEAACGGTSAAEELVVTIEPQAGYRVLGEGRVRLARLPAGASSVLAFEIKPLAAGPLPLAFHARFDDALASGHETRLEDRAEVFAARPGFRRIATNPYIAGPPVKSERMFFGRSDVFQFVRDNLAGRFQSNVLILHGNRRTGKSSILCQLERGDHVSPFIPVYLDLQGLGRLTTGSLFAALARKVSRALAGRGVEPPEAPAREQLEGDDAFAVMNDFLDELQCRPGGSPRLLIMLDEFEVLEDKVREGRVDREVFGWLRSLMQHAEGLAFILAGTHRLSELDGELWAPLLALALYRHVGFLAEGDARRLVTEPLGEEAEFDDLALEGILRLTAGHPYYVQLLGQLLVNQINERAASNVVTLEDLNQATEKVIEAGGGQFTYEWSAPRRHEARLALAALAELADSAAVWVEHDAVAARAGLAPALAEEGLREAVARDLVLASSGAYRIRFDLLRLWLRRERPVERVRAELGRG